MEEVGFFLVLYLFVSQCSSDIGFISDNKFKEWGKKGGMSSKGLGLRYIDPVSDHPEYRRISQQFDLTKPVNGVPVSVTAGVIAGNRIRDVYTNRMMPYFHNLLEFHDKIHQTSIWTPQPELTFSSDPYQLLNAGCGITELGQDILLDFVTPNDVLTYSDAVLRDACLERGSIPVLRCKEFPGRIFKCICNTRTQQARWIPYSFDNLPQAGDDNPNITIQECIPQNGRVCNDAANVKCNKTTECIDGVCSGKLASLTVSIGGATYTDEEVREILKEFDFMTFEEAIEYLFLRSNAKGILRTQCNEDFWKYATDFPQYMINEFNNTDLYNDIFHLYKFKLDYYNRYISIADYTDCSTFSEIIKDIYFKPPTDFPTNLTKDEHLKLYRQRADIYDDTVRCLDEYPRMICKSKDDNRGRCNCMTSEDSGSPYFNFIEEDGFCVGELNSVCTTVRGSSKYQCKRGLECRDVLQKPNPNAFLTTLTNTVIKQCQDPDNDVPGTTRKPKPNFSSRIEKDFSIQYQLLYTIIIIYIL